MNWDPVETIADVSGSLAGRVLLYFPGNFLTIRFFLFQIWMYSLVDWPNLYLPVDEIPYLGHVILLAVLYINAAIIFFFIKSLQEEYFLPSFLKVQFCISLDLFLASADSIGGTLAGIVTTSLVVFLYLQVRKRLGTSLI